MPEADNTASRGKAGKTGLATERLEMTRKHDYLIGEAWTKSSRTMPVTNPYTQEVIAEVCMADTDAIVQALEFAERAFQTTRNQPAFIRSKICQQVAQGIQSRLDEFARTITMESGKPLVFSRAEVNRSISTFKIAAEEALRPHGEVLTLDISEAARGKSGLTNRFPIGPIAGISPFNFPLNLVAHKVAPALATGNPIVLKPSSTTPLTALLLAEVILQSDAVKGSISILPCSGKDAGPMVEDDRFKMITFTGSPEVGWGIKSRAGKKKVTLELGGNAAAIIEPDADLDFAAGKVSFGSFAYSGQVCISVQRTFVHESIFDAFVGKLLAAVSDLKSGDPLDETINFGPMIDCENAERIESWVAQAKDDGAKILAGGPRKGSYYPPTILTGVDPRAKVSCNEAFGPILVLEPYSDFDACLEQVNDSDFGLQAGLFTQQMDKSLKAFNRLEVGGLILNDVPTFRVDNMPYGGVKNSGFGREGLRYSMEEMTELKLLVFNNQRET
jgi:glyceraldehyde-3-phosphate dehydrogenase (NADP+)